MSTPPPPPPPGQPGDPNQPQPGQPPYGQPAPQQPYPPQPYPQQGYPPPAYPPGPPPKKSKTLRNVLIIIGTLLVLSLGGCLALVAVVANMDPEVDVPALEADIESGVKDQMGVTVTADCPEDVTWKTGDSFDCTVTDDDTGETSTVVVDMDNDDGDMTWNLN